MAFSQIRSGALSKDRLLLARIIVAIQVERWHVTHVRHERCVASIARRYPALVYVHTFCSCCKCAPHMRAAHNESPGLCQPSAGSAV